MLSIRVAAQPCVNLDRFIVCPLVMDTIRIIKTDRRSDDPEPIRTGERAAARLTVLECGA